MQTDYDELILLLHDLVYITETKEIITADGVAPWYIEKVDQFYNRLQKINCEMF